ILDSRGRPTVHATCTLEGGIVASASVPSGESRGKAEAFELRDGDPRRYRGMGCRRAASSISDALHDGISGREFSSQSELDSALLAVDGTADKSRLGANAILAGSVAFARAHAGLFGTPLYQHFAHMLGACPDSLPRLSINLFSGGKHAGQQVSIQDVLIVPMSARTIDEALVTTAEIYLQAAESVFRKYGMRLLTADEGGLAPPFKTVNEMFALAVEAIERAGYVAGRDVALAVDVASTHFFKDQQYLIDGMSMDSAAMISVIGDWLSRYPIISIEDGLAEDDWESWPRLRQAVRGKAVTLGDDLLCTNPDRIQRAINSRACDALLLKVNQIGTLTEAMAAYKQARSARWSITLSVRIVETDDNCVADLAVGWCA